MKNSTNKVMKKFTLILLAGLIGLPLFAQDTAEEKPSAKDRVTIGARLGLSFPNMLYNDEGYKWYKHQAMVSGLGGVYVEVDLYKGLSIRPEIAFIGRGVKLKNSYEDINYKLRVTYMDWRVPVMYTFLKGKKVQPYLAIAPTLSFALGGGIDYESDKEEVKMDHLTKASIYPIDFSFYFAVGCKFPVQINNYEVIFGAEFGYNIGVCNTFAKKELSGTAEPENYWDCDVRGSRHNSGFELAMTVGFPLSNIKKSPKQKKTVEEKLPEKKVTQPLKTEEKECYSLAEMIQFINDGVDVSDKKICVFDLKFDFGKATLKKESENYLNQVADLLTAYPTMKVQINGHTDNVGNDEYNLKLSFDRADAVRSYLVRKGINKERMTVKGFGPQYPLDTNDTEEGRAKNRRVEIEILQVK